MDFEGIVNVESPYDERVVTNETTIDFWGVPYHYNSNSEVTPAKYLFIKGVAYYERKESGWVLKNFKVTDAKSTDKDKIADLK